ncbi:MAG: alpha/beta fold hydrolase [Bacteroidota bacterium]
MQLFYRQYGQEENPIIILHGLLGISDNWVSFAKSLSPNENIIIPDLRNHGQSPHSKVHNYDAMVDDVIELMDVLKIEKANIIGHSMGGKVAMKLAFLYPERLRKLMVVDISPRSYKHYMEHQSLIEAMLSLDFDEIATREQAESFLSKFIPEKRLLLFISKNLYWIKPNRLGWRLNLHSLYENLPFIYEEITSNFASKIPALFVKGGLSSYITPEDIPLLEKLFTHLEIKTIDKAGHWVHADAMEDLLSITQAYFEIK